MLLKFFETLKAKTCDMATHRGMKALNLSFLPPADVKI